MSYRGQISYDTVREYLVEFAESQQLSKTDVEAWIKARGGLRRVKLDPAKCGTIGNYRAHRRRNEYPCQLCIEAKNADSRRRWQAARSAS